MAIGWHRHPLHVIGIPVRPPQLAATGTAIQPGFRSQFQVAGLPFTYRPTAGAPAAVQVGFRSQFQAAGLPFTRLPIITVATASAVTTGLYLPLPRRRRRR